MPRSIKGEQFPEWETITFGDMFEEIKQKTSDTEKYPLYSLTIENGVTEKTERYERSFLVTKDEDNYKIVPPNAFVYNPMNLRFGALAVNHTGKTVSVSQYYNVFKMKDESVLPFWENYLVMPSMLRFYFSIATGSLLEKLRVYYSDFVKVKKKLPSIEEQRKISEFLSLYDKYITVQATKIEALEARRNGLLQQIFSQEIRFKADDGKEYEQWEETEIGTYLAIRNEKQVPTNDAPLKAFVANIGVTDKGEKYDRSHLVKNDDKKYKRTELNDFIYSSNNLDVGSIGLNTYGTAVISDVYEVFKIKKDINPTVLNYAIQKRETLNNIILFRQGCLYGQYKIYPEDFLSVEISVPTSAEEQKKIVEFFKLLDKQIEIEKDKLEAIKNVKKGLLQQMFV